MAKERLNFLIVEPKLGIGGSLSEVVRQSKIANECEWASDLKSADSAIRECVMAPGAPIGKVLVVDGDKFSDSEVVDFLDRIYKTEAVRFLACILVKSKCGEHARLSQAGQFIHLNKPLSFIELSGAVASLGLGWELKNISGQSG